MNTSGLVYLPASLEVEKQAQPPPPKRTGKGFRMGDLTVMVLREKEAGEDVLALVFQVKDQPRQEARFVGRSRKEFLRAVQDAIHGQYSPPRGWTQRLPPNVKR